MIRDFVRGFRSMMQVTCFRGPWAYQCMGERAATPVESAYDFGEWVAMVLVRGEERRKYAAHGNGDDGRSGESK